MKKYISIVLIISLLIFMFIYKYKRTTWYPYYSKIRKNQFIIKILDYVGLRKNFINNTTHKQIILNLSEKNRSNLRLYFNKHNLDYPPKHISLICIKDQKIIQMWSSTNENWIHVKNYKILGCSGNSGPKLLEGDLQVPEGIYYIEKLIPNGSNHLSLLLNYPNDFDRKMAILDKRSNIGGNIMIHGGEISYGCLAIGDAASEELYILANDTKIENIKIIIVPSDLRVNKLSVKSSNILWINELYNMLKENLSVYK